MEQRNKMNWWKNVGLKPHLQPIRYKLRYIKSFLLIIILFCSLFLCEKCFAFSLFEHNKIDKGYWTLVNDSMLKARYNATANLLPDGNVLIMGEEEFKLPNVAEIFDPKQQKIIKTIPIKQHFLWHEVSAISLKNGDVYISYNSNGNKKDLKAAVMIFDSKTYTFKNINNSFEDKVASTTDDIHILLKNGYLLIVPKSCGKRDILLYDSDKNAYYKVVGNYPTNRFTGTFFELENGDIIFWCVHGCCIYKIEENKFEIYKDLPRGRIEQIDKNSYLKLNNINDSYAKAGIYNLETEKIKFAKNKIKGWIGAYVFAPKIVLLNNGNILVTGVYLSKFFKEYTTYIYSRADNKFYKIQNPPIKIFQSTAHVKLSNGDILFVGGNHGKKGKKIQIYSYKNKGE